MRMRFRNFVFFFSTVVIAPAVGAQASQFPQPGHTALVGTATGGLPPYVTRDQVMDYGSPLVIHVRYGLRQVDSSRTHSVAGTGEFPFLRGRMGFTLGIQRQDSLTSALGSIEYQAMMSRGALTPNPSGIGLVLGLKLEAGASTLIEGNYEQTLFTGGFSIIMSVPFGDEIKLVPFVTPGIGFGMVNSDGQSDFEPQMMIGAGLVIHNPSRLDLTIGGHRTMADGARTVVGLGITWNR